MSKPTAWEKAGKPTPSLVDGLMMPPHPFAGVSMADHINDIKNLSLRNDDLFLCAYPKAGTHWLWEVMSMLLNGSAEYERRAKEHNMMEFATKDILENLASPRIFNTHLPFTMLPVKELKQHKTKVVHVYRNPKDTVVSMWFHFKQLENLGQNFDEFVKSFAEGPAMFGQQMQYLEQFQQFTDQNPDVPIFNVSFEETKRSPVAVIQRLAVFLGVSASDQLCRDIADACDFQKMKKANETKTLPEGTIMPLDQNIYRKGDVGDWKNHLSAEHLAVMDSYIAQHAPILTKFKMQYTSEEQ